MMHLSSTQQLVDLLLVAQTQVFIRILGDDEDGSGDEIIAYSGISGNVITIATNGRNHDGTSGSSTRKST